MLSLQTDPFFHPWPDMSIKEVIWISSLCESQLSRAVPLRSLMLCPYISPLTLSSQSCIGPVRPGPAFNTTLYEISMQMTHFVFSVNHHCKCQAHYSQILQGVVTSISGSGEGRFLKGPESHIKRLLSDYTAGDMHFLVCFILSS